MIHAVSIWAETLQLSSPPTAGSVGVWHRGDLDLPLRVEQVSLADKRVLVQVREAEGWTYYSFRFVVSDKTGL